MPSESSLESALSAWRAALGESGVTAAAEALDRYARTTQPEGTRPACILYPESTDAVRAALAIAARHGIGVYPVSRGCNWGYGDACAPTAGAAIFDLSRMNRIIEVNPELGYAVVEPGVTQAQLHARVREAAPGYWMDSTGAGESASVLGNVLERGFGHTPYGDHVRSLCGMEIVLAEGEVLRTGFCHYDGARAARVFPYGVGPILDGLFMQSNFGIVTQIGLWLYPIPEAFRFFFVRVEREDALGALVDALRPLRMRGILNSAVHIGNDLRIISSLRPYPWEESGGAAPLTPALRARLRQENGLGAWNVSGSLAGTAGQVRAAARALRQAVRPVGRVVFVDDRKIAWGQRAVALLGRFGLGRTLARQLEALIPNYGLLKGIPTDEPVIGAQWRLRTPAPEHARNPRDAGCGLLWISPVLPLRGSDAAELAALTAPIFAAHGFDFLATFTMLNERSMVAILNVAYDKALEAENHAAAACYHAVMDALRAKGFVPYRLSVYGMREWVDPADTFWQTAVRIKRALDPGDIIARGRYVPPLDGE